MKLNNNKQRQVAWNTLTGAYSPEEIQVALQTLSPDTRKVLQWHYMENIPLIDIPQRLGKTISVVRNHQRRGIYQLVLYFDRNNTK